MFQAELPQNIWNANYSKTYLFPRLTSKAWSLTLDKELGLLLGHTWVHQLEFQQFFSGFNKSEFPQMKEFCLGTYGTQAPAAAP